VYRHSPDSISGSSGPEWAARNEKASGPGGSRVTATRSGSSSSSPGAEVPEVAWLSTGQLMNSSGGALQDREVEMSVQR
jgi:hypothetical protein